METSPMFFIKMFLFLIVLFVFITAALYGFIFFCTSATIAKSIKGEAEKMTEKDIKEIERNAKADARILFEEKLALKDIEHKKEINKIKKENK